MNVYVMCFKSCSAQFSAYLHIIVQNVISSVCTLIVVLILFLNKYLINKNLVFIEKASKERQLLKQHVLLSRPKCHEVEPLHAQSFWNRHTILKVILQQMKSL